MGVTIMHWQAVLHSLKKEQANSNSHYQGNGVCFICGAEYMLLMCIFPLPAKTFVIFKKKSQDGAEKANEEAHIVPMVSKEHRKQH